MTALFAYVLLAIAVFLGLRLAYQTYVPSVVAGQIRAIQIGLALKHFRDRLRYMSSRELRMLFGYRKCIRELQVAAMLRRAYEVQVAKLGPNAARLSRHTKEYAMIERYYERKLRQAADFLGGMSDARLECVATAFRDELLAGLVPVSVVADFFRDERQTIRDAPHMAVGHYGRAVEKMRSLLKAVKAARGL